MLPHLRLGSGKDGSPQSMDELKKHPWFTKHGVELIGKDGKAQKNNLEIMSDVTRFYQLKIPGWPKQYKMKFCSDNMARYYAE